ncbi:hypothetical protein EVAR_81288_1 [Eumeta japonica]|uniref:Uncharacterized protein n=1 Tax=Eumeta variegata TaxID=151549 RepID=A0A4C1W2S9_EUMVA|nr:hypothetical protein EVAR_81288_1 [Eumeta japonica]
MLTRNGRGFRNLTPKRVSVVAEEVCTCVCWPRMRLERVLRHRPALKVVFDSLIAKKTCHRALGLRESDIVWVYGSQNRPAELHSFPGRLGALTLLGEVAGARRGRRRYKSVTARNSPCRVYATAALVRTITDHGTNTPGGSNGRYVIVRKALRPRALRVSLIDRELRTPASALYDDALVFSVPSMGK